MPNEPQHVLPVTCTIITQNEEDRIGATLASIEGLVAEIVVVDSGSTDRTIEICKAAGARVVHRDWTGFGPQKRAAEDEASHDWVLNLDADEVLTEALASDIRALFAADLPALGGYRFRQVNVYPGESKPRPWADYHNYIRLYDRTRMRFRESPVHDTVDEKGQPTGQLAGVCLHHSVRSLEHLARKLDSYTSLQATALNKPRWQLLLRRPLEYPVLLLRYVFLKRHITGGRFGLRYAHTVAKGRAQRIPKLLKRLDEQSAQRD